mmetsp:Transcript_28885/g.21505  ORF Transcript_28885/g.21505 Transcript_28885/m.21505 type:complete len:81 (+) Transcript_28885:399-641(+)
MLMMEERLRDVIKIIKAKNPTLLQLIQKGAMKSVQGGMIKAGVTAEQVVQTGGATLKNANSSQTSSKGAREKPNSTQNST